MGVCLCNLFFVEKTGTRLKISPPRLIIAPLGLIITPFNFNNRPVQLKTASAPVFNRSRITKNKLERQTPMTYYYILWKYNFAWYPHFKYATQRYKTPTEKTTQEPKWDFHINFDIPEGDNRKVSREVFDLDKFERKKITR